MEVELTKKQLALQLIEDLQFVADLTEKELNRLKKVENHKFTPPDGQSALQFHLGVLKELVEGV